MQLMQETVLSDRRPPGRQATQPNPARTLNVSLIYQDALTRQWAEEERERAAEVVGRGAIRCTEWRVDDLVEPTTFSQGAAALARSQVIVVALHESEPLPAAFYRWVNVWLQQRAGLPGALVALLVRSGESQSGAEEKRNYLCAIAHQGGLAFLTQEYNPARDSHRIYGERTRQLAKAA